MAAETNKQDVTLEMLSQSEEFFRHVFVHAAVGMALTGLHGRFLQVNPACCALSGYSAEELLQMDFLSVTHPQDRETNRKLRQDLLDGNIPAFVLEKRCVKKSGEVFWARISVSPVRDRDGKILHTIAVIEDITEQKEAERACRGLAAIVESSDDAIVGKTLEGIITSWNKAAECMFGYSEQEAVGKHIDIIIPAALYQEEEDIIGELRQHRHIQHYETVRLRKDGRPIDVSLSISPIKDRAGNIIGVAKIARDITGLKELERKKDEFIAMASHELKTPLTSLNGFLHLLGRHLGKQQDEHGFAIMNRVNREMSRLIKLVADLLDISKIQTGQLEYQEEPFDLDALAQEIVEVVQAGITSHRIRVEGQACASVFGDKGRIGQVLMNLLTNAIKYSRQADIIIVRLSADQENVRVSVQDFGDGIAKEYQQKIFGRYYQVSDSGNHPYAGLGMGLYLANEIIKHHRGSIWVESTEGEGAIFSFTLPVQKRDAACEI